MTTTNAAYEHNGNPIDAKGFYQIACNPHNSVAIEACAGSGKTWLLVSRVVLALLDGALPQQILVITFTNKAAGEIKDRLQTWLADFALMDDAQLQYELMQRGLSNTEASLKAPLLQGLYRRLLLANQSVQIMTFHAWFLILMRHAPTAILLQLKLPLNPIFLLNDEMAIAKTWRPFHLLLTQPQHAQQKQDFDAFIIEHGQTALEDAMKSLLAKRIPFILADAHRDVALDLPPAGCAYSQFTGFDGAQAALEKHPQLREALYICAQTFTNQTDASTLEQAVTLGDLQAVFNVFFTEKGKGHARNKLKTKKLTQEQGQFIDHALMWANDLRNMHQHEQLLVYHQRLTRLGRLFLQAFGDVKRQKKWVDGNDIEHLAQTMLSDHELSGWLQEKLDSKIKHLLMDEFQDTSPLQWQAVHGWLSGYGGDVGLNNAPSVCVVGDPKQSIYRFRSAEPKVFAAAQAFITQGMRGSLLSCDHTRRNAPVVIGCVNAVMSNLQDTGQWTGFRWHTTASTQAGELWFLPEIQRPSATKSASKDSVKSKTEEHSSWVWRDTLTQAKTLAKEKINQQEYRQAAQFIAHAIQTKSAISKKMMVLARTRQPLFDLQIELNALGVPNVCTEKNKLVDAPEVQDVVALLDALVSPWHDLSLLRALKSPLFGVDDAQLIDLFLLKESLQNQEKAGMTWLDAVEDMAKNDIEPWKSTHVQFKRWQKWVQELPVHDALAAIFADGDVFMRFTQIASPEIGQRMLSNLNALLMAALNTNSGRYTSAHAFVRAMQPKPNLAAEHSALDLPDALPAASSAILDGVRLLTVHSAKGLEADWVLLLNSNPQKISPQKNKILMDWPLNKKIPAKFFFVKEVQANANANVNNGSGGGSLQKPDASLYDLMNEDMQAEQREENNLLYVALTRAKNCLVVSSTQPKNNNTESWRNRLNAADLNFSNVDGAFMNAAMAPERITTENSTRTINLWSLPALPLLSKQAVTCEVEVEVEVTADADEKNANIDVESRIGQAMHRLLQWQNFSDKAITQIATDFELKATQAKQAHGLAMAIWHGEGKWCFDETQLQWQGNEVELVYKGKLLRMDRLVQRRTDGSWWILDFKSSHHPEKDVALVGQLHAYRRALQFDMPDAQIKIAFLTGAGQCVVL